MVPGMVANRSDLTPRVLIVGGVRLLRESLAGALTSQPEVQLMGTATVSEAFTLLAVLRPNVILTDSAIVMSTRLVVAADNAGARVVVLGVADEDEDEVAALAGSGVAGFVGREAGLDELLKALETVLRGDVQCSARVAAAVCRRLTTLVGSGPSGLHSRLTHREGEVAALIEQGLSNKEIGVRLCVATATVKNHVRNLLTKLGVHRRALAAGAVRSEMTNATLPDRSVAVSV